MAKRQSFRLVLVAVMAFGITAWGEQATIPASATVNVGGIPLVPAHHRPATNAKPRKVSRWHRHEAKKMFLAGAKAMEKKDPGAAETYFLRAHELDPNNQDYSLSAEIARQYVVTQFVQRAEREKELGNNLDSLAALQEALRFDPKSPLVTAYVNTLAADVSARPRATPRQHDEAAAPTRTRSRKRKTDLQPANKRA